MIRLERFDHVVITSTDSEKSVAFYRDLFGLELQQDGPPGLKLLRGGGIEIGISPARTRQAISHPPADHIAFRVASTSLESVKSHLDQCGVAYQVTDGRIYLKDPDQYLLELELA